MQILYLLTLALALTLTLTPTCADSMLTDPDAQMQA